MTTKVVIIDDEVFVRKGVISSIAWNQYDMELVGETSDGQSGLELVREVKPDIVITDIRMPNMNGLEMVRAIRKEMPPIKILVLSVLDDFETLREALRLGVDDYIHKLSEPEELLEVILKLKRSLESPDPLNERATSITQNTHPSQTIELWRSIENVDSVMGRMDHYKAGPAASEFHFFQSQHLKDYQASLESGNFDKLEDAFTTLFPHEIDEAISPQVVRDSVYQWLSTNIILLREWGGYLEGMFQGQSPFEQIQQIETYHQLRDWCYRFHLLIQDMLQTLKATKSRSEIQHAIDYIKLHFHEPLRVQDIARIVNLSENYFSNLFTKETGKNFTQFLQETRIEKAKELLRTREKDWTEVGIQIGFDEPKYFSKIFKRLVGKTPVQFQNGK
jgi:two-component system, response regulator YesN